MTTDDIQELALEFGIDRLAAVTVDDNPVLRANYAAAIASLPEGFGYLARGLERRMDPSKILPGARSMFIGLVAAGGLPERPEPIPDGHGWISRFAWCRDYHTTVGTRFSALAEALSARIGAHTRWYVDTGAVLEKAWAAYAGLGFIGRNTLLISPDLGSFCFIGVVITDIEVPAAPAPEYAGCGNCDACVQACPTGALDGAGGIDVSRCLAHLTVTCRDTIEPDIDLAGNIFGCDICQDACPWNSPRRPTHCEFSPLPGLFCPALDDIATICSNPDTFKKVFGDTPISRRGPAGLAMTIERLRQKSSLHK